MPWKRRCLCSIARWSGRSRCDTKERGKCQKACLVVIGHIAAYGTRRDFRKVAVLEIAYLALLILGGGAIALQDGVCAIEKQFSEALDPVALPVLYATFEFLDGFDFVFSFNGRIGSCEDAGCTFLARSQVLFSGFVEITPLVQFLALLDVLVLNARDETYIQQQRIFGQPLEGFHQETIESRRRFDNLAHLQRATSLLELIKFVDHGLLAELLVGNIRLVDIERFSKRYEDLAPVLLFFSLCIDLLDTDEEAALGVE